MNCETTYFGIVLNVRTIKLVQKNLEMTIYTSIFKN